MKKSLYSIIFLALSLFNAAKLEAQISVNQISFCPEVELAITGGNPPYTIHWGDGSTSMVPLHAYSSFGTYTVEITDQAGVQSSYTVSFNDDCYQLQGNTYPCVGSCEDYQIGSGSLTAPEVNYTTTPNGINVCWEEPGVFLILDNQDQWFIINVQESPLQDIVSLGNTTCQDTGEPESCEKTCAHSTAIYTIPEGQEIEWSVDGADSYEVNENQVIVNWGAPGNGLVTAHAEGSQNINILCNSIFLDNSLIANPQTNINPIMGQWIGPGGFTSNEWVLDLQMDSILLGQYTFIGTASNGDTGQCSVFLEQVEDCLFAYDYAINKPTECDSCDASVVLNISDGLNQDFFFEWSNGSTSQNSSTFCAGSGSVTVTNSSDCQLTIPFNIECKKPSCPSEKLLCVEILEEPEAKFSTLPATQNGVVNICEGGTVFFNNESIGATIFEWNFGNENMESTINGEQTYSNSGTYQVALIARNDCFCGDTAFVTVIVSNAVTPSLDCVGTICEGETVTYSSAASCGNFNWTITGNYTIIDGGGISDNYVEIEWITGPSGTIELSVSDCSGTNYCLEPTLAVIPILSNDETIEGPSSACQQDEVSYSINDYTATDFIWTISSGGIILDGQNTNSILVRWTGNPSITTPQSISVDYNNCYLGCGGSDQKDVFILPKFYVEGDIESCTNGTSTHTAREDLISGNLVSCHWTLSSNGSIIWSSTTPSPQINLDWDLLSPVAGKYLLTAIPNNALSVCGSEYVTSLNLVEPPEAPTAINGVTEICAGATYTYEVISSNPNNIFNWIIYDGSNITNQTGKKINATFGNTPPYSIFVNQTNSNGLSCVSANTSINLTPIVGISITGANEVCEESTSSYTVKELGNVTYDWAITPANAGTIITGQGTHTIDVFWHGPYTAEVAVSMCSVSEKMGVTVIGKPEPTISGDLFVCPGAYTIIGTDETYNAYLWQDENSNLVSVNSTASVYEGAYELIVTNSTGCTNNIAFEIEGYPDPEINISVNGSRTRCYTGTSPDPAAAIHATEIPTGYSYQWYHNGNTLLGETTSTLLTTAFGEFQVAVVDIYGCETYSNKTTIFDYCGTGGGGGGGGVCNNPNLPQNCVGGTNVQMSVLSTSVCNVYDFQNNSPNYDPSTVVQWYFDDPGSGVNNNSSIESPSHSFSKEGHFIVILTAQTPADLLCWDSILVTVPLFSNFDFGTACANELVQFEDLTGFLPGEVVQTWSWDFGDPSSSTNTSTIQNPSHLFSSAGTFLVTLTTTNTGGCTSTITKEVIIQAVPNIAFDKPAYTCELTALNFLAQASTNVVSYEWDFGEPTSGATNTSEIKAPYHAYDKTGNYQITCQVTNIWGCVNNETKTISVTPNTLSGAITFSTPSPICEGSTTTLSAPVGGSSWIWSTGANTEVISLSTADAVNVIMTNAEGCSYASPIVILEVIPEPSATIQAIEYDEFGQAVNAIYNSYSTCEGEDVFLQVDQNGNYTYTWSNGAIGNELSFTEARNNLLGAGTYTFDVSILDNATGCTNTAGPFEVVIHPSPTNIQISSNATPPICATQLTTLSVDNPQTDMTYVWNTGVFANDIQVSIGGDYFVRGITTFGCSGESNTIIVKSGPDIKKIPNGCHTRCAPDTICLPALPTVTSYQWYINDVPIASPAGNVANLVAKESGTYHVVMVDNIGCETVSDDLNLDLFIGTGTFNGSVYMDVNDNGIIDSGDTLVSGIDIIINSNGTPVDTTTSATDGTYSFNDIPAIDYHLEIDINGLPKNIYPVYNPIDSSLVGCDDVELVDWLLHVSCSLDTTLVLDTICFGETYILNGTTIVPNTPTTIIYTDEIGCDSVIIATIEELPNYNLTTTLIGCEGDSVAYNGVFYLVGTTHQVSLVSQEGCDYIETIIVLPYPSSAVTAFNIDVCKNEMATFNGTEYAPGTQTIVTLNNQVGCDSLVNLSVNSTPPIAFTTTTNEPCWNSNAGEMSIPNTTGVGPFEYSLDGVNYQATPKFDNLKPNTYSLHIQDANGCEATESVTIIPLPRLTFELIAPDLPCDGLDVQVTSTILSGDFSSLSYIWSTGQTTPEISANQAESYALSITNDCETVSNDIQLLYEADRDEYIYIPNSFSPNGDGKNDILEINIAPNVIVKSMELNIYDRWGNLIFQSNDSLTGWNGNEFNSGVFVYHLKAKLTSCGRTFDYARQGDITLINGSR